MKTIRLKNLEISNDKSFTLISGPCQMQSEDHAMETAGRLVEICGKLGIGLIYKTSFDKANRTSATAQRGIGLEKSKDIFLKVKEEYNIPVLTDVHSEQHCIEMKDVVDVVQIPAFLCRQTDLLKAAAQTGLVVNVKKGQFLAPWDMKNVSDKLEYFGAKDIMLTERGASFGYNTLVSDMRSLSIMARTGHPVIFDATHSVQQPGGLGGASGGQREFVEILARAAIAVGVAGVFMESHEDPDNAPSDGPCMVNLQDIEKLLETLKKFDEISKRG